MDKQDRQEVLEPGGRSFNLNPSCSRRQVLKWGGMSIIGISALGPALARGESPPLIIVEQAQGIVVADPSRCVGCGRCELACTEFNDGKAAPTISRIKIDRNLSFGTKAAFGWRQGEGNWGDGQIVQDLCKQCPHPVPCADICPEGAIMISPATKARMVDLQKCNGCKKCLKACPWEMISFDPESNKVTKCSLCDGKPKCVEACPAEALSYVPWRDLTDKVPARIVSAALPPERAMACEECHLPGQKKSVGMFLDAAGGRTASPRKFGFKWIDLGGTVLLPVVFLGVVVHAVMRGVKK